VTAHPTAQWTAQQLREAFPWDSAPRDLLRDRDQIFGNDFVDQVKAMGIKQVLSAPRSPWQRAYIERLIGSIRRECLDHVIVLAKALCIERSRAILLTTISGELTYRSARMPRSHGEYNLSAKARW
jgi:transposase InsO family protein